MLIFILQAGIRTFQDRRMKNIRLKFVHRGPDDNGLVVDGPGRLAKKAFENGALHVTRTKV